MDARTKITPLYAALKKRIQAKLPSAPHAICVLPDGDVDFDPLFDVIIPADMPKPETNGRARFDEHWQNLQYNAKGQPWIVAYHMLFISYLRRQTPFTNEAKALFYRLWNEHGEALLAVIRTRDLISALRTFADHPQNEAQGLRAKLGFQYGHMIKIYESERKAEGRKPAKAGYAVPGGCPNIGIAGTYGVRLGGDNSFEIANVILAEEIERDVVVGAMIRSLMERVHQGRTVFSRYDNARVEAGYRVDSEREWAFGLPPQS